METHFSRREWLLWTLGGALAWFLFHPRGSSMAIDSLQFTSGAALFTTLQCLVLGRAVPEFRAQVLWLTSAALWLFAGIGFWMLPWRFWS